MPPTEIIIIVLLIIVIGLLIFNKNGKENSDAKDDLQQAKESILVKQQENLSSMQTLTSNMEHTEKLLLEKLESISEKNNGTSQLLTSVSDNITEMNRIMVNKKSRGNWGEYQLNTLLSIYCGDSQEVFETQYSLKSGVIGDAALHLPGSDSVMILDSKFPMEDYQKLIDASDNTDISKSITAFKGDIKKHIDDISKKYITKETVDFAVMFIPSEAIYTYICAEQSELINYGHFKHVLLTSPTTLLGVVFTLVNATKNFNRSKHVKDIEKIIVMMADDSRRLAERMEKVQKAEDMLNKSLKDARISADKINNRIQKLADGYIEE